MYPFSPLQTARFSCEADFASGAYLNLHFLDGTRTNILFHLSLRRDEGLVVVNRREARGWRREIRLPHGFGHRATPVELRFSARSVAVWIDGQRLGRFDAFPRPDAQGRFLLRRGFPGLSGITHVEVEGACRADSVQIATGFRDGDDRPEGLHLHGSLDVAFLTDRAVAEPALLQIAGFDEALSMASRKTEGGARRELLTSVPGRVWDGAGDALDMTLCDAQGTALGTLTLTRAEMAARIGAVAETGGLIHGDRVALTAIEHVRHARLLGLLGAAQREAVFQAAERFGLGEYLLAGDEGGKTGFTVFEPREDPTQTALLEFRRRFGHDIGLNAGDPLAVIDRLRVQTGLPDAALPDALIALTEWFCLTDRLPLLAEYWRQQGLPPAETFLDETSWKQSALLPLIYAEGAYWRVCETIGAMTQSRRGWVVTPALGWVADRIAQAGSGGIGASPKADEKQAVLAALLHWVDARAPEYWAQTPCERLIDGLVSVLATWPEMASDQRQTLEWTLVRVFGLAPSFWDRVAQRALSGGRALPPLVHAAHEAWLRLEGAVMAGKGAADGSATIDDALGFFQHVGNVDYARFRRDLLGPSGRALASGRLPDWESSLKAGVDPFDAIVRHVAHPQSAAIDAVPPHAAALIRSGIAATYDRVPTSTISELQPALFDAARALLDGAGSPDIEDRFLRLAGAVSGPQAAFLGVGVGVSVVNGLLTKGDDAVAERIAGAVLQSCAAVSDPAGRLALQGATAPAMALQALLRAHPGHGLGTRLQSGMGIDSSSLPPAPVDDRTPDLLARATPVLGTLVALYSCQPNLPTRVQAIRDGWAAGLAALGIPYLVFVGGGDGRREGDVVYLDAPDSYEALPQKSLAMARWVLEHTGFSHVHKIDDDCFLDPEAFHGSLSPLKCDYYGRPLVRRRGDMDRAWHMTKSQSARGRLELDKSPEPSTYADGSTSWVLSRRGMARLIDAADSPQGRDLIRVSFMEDKLVGDLLAMRGTKVNGEDFRGAILRRTRPGGPLVPQWENGFLPFAGSGIKMAHLDGHDRQAEILAASQRPWPLNAKIWPSYQKARFGWNTDTLDLISSREQLQRVNEAPVTVVACLRNEAFLLNRFLDHYRALGVEGFLIADNGSDDGSFEILADQPDVALFAVDTDYGHSHYGVAWQQALLANFRCGRWSLIADADEFLFWNRDLRGSLPDLAGTMDAEGADAARVMMLDMYPQGPLSGADFQQAGPFEQAPFVDQAPFLQNYAVRGPFSNSPVWTSALRHRLLPGSRPDLFVAQKYALLKYRPWMRLSAGLHFAANTRVSQQELFFGHFKYNAAFRAKAEAEVARKQHFNNAEEYRKYLALVSEGREVVFDLAVSLRWDCCDAVLDRLADDQTRSR